MPYFSETAKVRGRVRSYCAGQGVDLGCGSEKIVPSAVSVDGRRQVNPDHVMDISGGLAFRNAQFDYVFSSHALEHLRPTPGEILPEWWRILKPGGHLILYLPHKLLYRQPNPEHLHEFTPKDITPVIRRLGGVVIRNQTESGSNQFYSFLIVARKPRG